MKQTAVTLTWVFAIPMFFIISVSILAYSLAPLLAHFVTTAGIPRPAAVYLGLASVGLSLPATLISIYFLRKLLIKKFAF
jgi:hypothetical protein